jgi:hypothetical protein
MNAATLFGTFFGLACAMTGNWLLGIGVAAGIMLYVLVSTGIAGPLFKGIGKVLLCALGPAVFFGLVLVIIASMKGN